AFEARLDDPKTRPLFQRVIHRRIHRDANDDLPQLFIDCDILDRTDFRSAESHRTVSIEATCVGEADRDVATAEKSVAHDEISGDEDRQCGNDPDPRRPLRDMHARFGRRLRGLSALLVVLVVFAHCANPAVFHIIRGSKKRTANMRRAMIRNSGVAPGPVTISSMPRKLMMGAAMAAMNGMIIGHRTRRCRMRYTRVR